MKTVEVTTKTQAARPVPEWGIGPFERNDEVNPIIRPAENLFDCPITGAPVAWESAHTFNPTAVVWNGKVHMLYRAEDGTGDKIGFHTSRVGLAVSDDGYHFTRRKTPVLYPGHDSQEQREWPGGCEDPRVVATDDGRFVVMYSQWNRQSGLLGVATSTDLEHWTKHGPVFADAYGGRYAQTWSKSGAVVTQLVDGHMVAARINGKYWMYWGDTDVFAASSDDLIHWEPIIDAEGRIASALATRPGKFDSGICEPGPAAVLTDHGIVLLYNGMNDPAGKGDPTLRPGAYSGGQALFDPTDPTRLLDRSDDYFMTPERPYEVSGQYATGGTVFIQGLVHFEGKWLLYYGCADSLVAVATAVS